MCLLHQGVLMQLPTVHASSCCTLAGCLQMFLDAAASTRRLRAPALAAVALCRSAAPNSAMTHTYSSCSAAVRAVLSPCRLTTAAVPRSLICHQTIILQHFCEPSKQ